MPEFMEGYGVEDARRERWRKRALLGLIAGLIVSGILYFKFRNFREERQVTEFLDLLTRQDYKAAYALWGCTDANPCPDYALDKFMEDWGPKSPQADVKSMREVSTKSCTSGIIKTLKFGNNPEVQLWVSRGDRILSFAPWPICNPRMQVPPSATVQ